MSHHLEHVTRNADGNGFTIRHLDHEWGIAEAMLRSTGVYHETMSNIFGSIDPMPSAEDWVQVLLKADLL